MSPAKGKNSISSTPCDRYWKSSAADAKTAAQEINCATGVRLNFKIRPGAIALSIELSAECRVLSDEHQKLRTQDSALRTVRIRLFYALVPVLSVHPPRRPG